MQYILHMQSVKTFSIHQYLQKDKLMYFQKNVTNYKFLTADKLVFGLLAVIVQFRKVHVEASAMQ